MRVRPLLDANIRGESFPFGMGNLRPFVVGAFAEANPCAELDHLFRVVRGATQISLEYRSYIRSFIERAAERLKGRRHIGRALHVDAHEGILQGLSLGDDLIDQALSKVLIKMQPERAHLQRDIRLGVGAGKGGNDLAIRCPRTLGFFAQHDVLTQKIEGAGHSFSIKPLNDFNCVRDRGACDEALCKKHRNRVSAVARCCHPALIEGRGAFKRMRKRARMAILKAFLIAFSLALDVFAVSVGVGMRDCTQAERLRIGGAFVCAELLMTMIGALCGSVVLRFIGPVAGYLGFAALVGIGIYMIIESLGESEEKFDLSRGSGLLLGALAISVDSLGIGFSILFIGVPFIVTLGCIAFASVTATTAGFLLGRKLGEVVGKHVGIYAGVILALTGVGFAVLKATGHE